MSSVRILREIINSYGKIVRLLSLDNEARNTLSCTKPIYGLFLFSRSGGLVVAINLGFALVGLLRRSLRFSGRYLGASYN